MNRLTIAFLILLALLLSACNIPQAPTPAPATPTTPAEATATLPPTATLTSPTEPPSTPQPEPTATVSGFVVVDSENKEFKGYDLEGNLLFRYATGSQEAPTPREVQVVGRNVYFYSRLDKKLFRSNQEGLLFLPNLPGEHLSAFLVSPDEQKIAWAETFWEANPAYSTLWVGNMDGSDARQVAEFDVETTPAFYLVPLEWTNSGDLIFQQAMTGYGGYILYDGYNSLYAYSPSSGEITTYVPADELHGLCLDTYRLDLKRVVFHCDQEGPGIVARSLADGSEQKAPAIEGFPIVGSARYSPSGQRLAYSAARGNPEAEAGQVVVLPGDLSGTAQVLVSMEGGFYRVLGWVDEDTLLVARSEDAVPGHMTLLLSLDGRQKELARGWFVGLLR